jgi:hypothetical protein
MDAERELLWRFSQEQRTLPRYHGEKSTGNR